MRDESQTGKSEKAGRRESPEVKRESRRGSASGGRGEESIRVCGRGTGEAERRTRGRELISLGLKQRPGEERWSERRTNQQGRTQRGGRSEEGRKWPQVMGAGGSTEGRRGREGEENE